MGGATSRFAETDWDAKPVHNGGEQDNAGTATLDGTERMLHHTILSLNRPNIVNQRLFEIRNDADIFLYQSVPVEGTTKDFDFLQIGDDGEPRKVLRIHTDSAPRIQWAIFSYEPVWDGQQPANEDRLLNVVTTGETTPLYRKARVDISWDQHHGLVRLFEQNDAVNAKGVIMKDGINQAPLMKVEEIKSITPQYQSFVPTTDMIADALIHPPLAAHWVWENSPNRHQIKMHLTAGQDVALQCILAIITNQVHVEQCADE